jgi:nickel-type superoxide dismutase maturation protease
MFHGLEQVKIPNELKVIVCGDSMFPTFKDGDKVEFIALGNRLLRIGDIVLAEHPFQKKIKIIKRIHSIKDNNLYFLTGDNKNLGSSSDSHSFGLLSKDCILATSKINYSIHSS